MIVLLDGRSLAGGGRLLTAGAMNLLTVLTIEHAYQAICWSRVIVICDMILLSTALRCGCRRCGLSVVDAFYSTTQSGVRC
jgi:hypothetical protein